MSYTDWSIKERDTTAISPEAVVTRGARQEGKSIPGEVLGTFTGAVYLDRVLQHGNVSVANVNFQPCARTNWHKHEDGQLLQVMAGSGWLQNQGQKPIRISAGDIIWCPPGTIHWHGADDGSFMIHAAVTHGKIAWYGPVTEEEYAAKDDVGTQDVVVNLS